MLEMQNKEQQPLMVTIRCTVFNHEHYLRECLEGFVMQKTNFRFEAIVHDDASTDGSAAIIKEYAEKYPDIIKPIYETENQYSKHDGSLGRIMREHMYGKYIAWCEGDDYWTDPLKLQKQVDIMEQHPEYSMCCCRAKLYSEKKKDFIGEQRCSKRNGILRDKDVILNGGLYIATCGILSRRELYNSPKYNVSYISNCHVGDYPLQMFMAMQGPVFYFDEPMAVYRVENSTSWTGHNDIKKITSAKINGFISEIKMLEGFANDYPKYQSYFKTRICYYMNSQYILELDKESLERLNLAFAEYNKYRNLFWKLDYVFRVHGIAFTKAFSARSFGKLFRLYTQF